MFGGSRDVVAINPCLSTLAPKEIGIRSKDDIFCRLSTEYFFWLVKNCACKFTKDALACIAMLNRNFFRLAVGSL